MDAVAWPPEMLGRFLHFLALDGADRSFQQLAYLTCKYADLKKLVGKEERPLVLRIAFDRESNETTFIFPFCQSTVAKIEIHWGDGKVDLIQDSAVKYVRHEYAAAGEYTVRVFRSADAGSDKSSVALDHLGLHPDINESAWWKPLRSIDSLGDLGIRSLNSLFFGAEDIRADLSQLDVRHIENMEAMFYKAANFNQPIGGWDVSNVTNMAFMFYHAYKFNQPIGEWNVSNVTDMAYMFHHASEFDQPIGQWSVSNVTQMQSMFKSATRFNHDVGEWNVANVVNMAYMFCNASSFDQPIGDWNVGRVISMACMFNNATQFNQPIGDWNVEGAEYTESMFEGAVSFNQPIDKWNNVEPKQ
jgi:surface protein